MDWNINFCFHTMFLSKFIQIGRKLSCVPTWNQLMYDQIICLIYDFVFSHSKHFSNLVLTMTV